MPFRQKLCKFLFILLFLVFTLYLSFPEKWVGQAATYLLIEGSKTASGEPFDKEGLYAACNGFRLGSKVTIVNSKTGKSITVTINDRINDDSKYFILLTPKASKEIGFEWDTGLVVVNGDFSDINSTERIAINGLVREGEVDLENIKQFPEIKWPEEKQEDLTKPKVKEKEIPSKKNEVALLDEDEKPEKIDTQETPSEEKYLTPESKMREYMMSEDSDDKQLPEKDQGFAMTPMEKEKGQSMDTDKEDEAVQKKENVSLPNEENKYVMNPKEKQSIIDQDEEIKDDKEEQKEIQWGKTLESGKMYVRFFTGLNKAESEKKFLMYKKIFPSIIGIKENNKYILFAGPFDNNNIDLNLRNIRSYGFRDAYIINVK